MKGIKVKLFSMAIVLFMVFAGLVVLVPQNSCAKRTGIGYVDPEPMVLSPDKFAMSKTNVYSESVRDVGPNDPVLRNDDVGDPNGTVKGYFVSNDWTGSFDQVDMVKRGEDANCEVWVQENLSFPWGDPRNAFASQYTITDEQVEYIIDQFEEEIYPTETKFFSETPSLNGSDENITSEYGDVDTFDSADGHMTMIMISNIRDQNYYDPLYAIYIAGYYSHTVAKMYDRNVIDIDCWDWTNRTGDDVYRPFLYEGVMAHEFQHLLHDYVDPSEETWIDEGLSDFAEFLCGYGEAMAEHISEFLRDPSNSLTLWRDQGEDNILADYGATALFVIYLNDHFGGSTFIQSLFENNKTGTDSVTDTLKKNGYAGWNFEKVFRSWRLANLIHANQPGNGIYNYKSIDLDDYSSLGKLNYRPGAGLVSRSDYFDDDTATSTVGAYGTDYVYLSQGKMRVKDRLSSKFAFYGDDKDMSNGWEHVGDTWSSGPGNETDQMLRGQIDLGQGGAGHTLSIYTWYDIEQDWDFGMVQVSMDGSTWISLSMEGVTVSPEDAVAANPDIYPAIPDQLPGITGTSNGWTWLTFDLSEYDGMKIWVQFRYMTDWATTGDGWHINDILVDGMDIDHHVFEPEYPDVTWIVTLVMYRGDRPVIIIDLKVNSVNDATYRIWQLTTLKSAYVLISPRVGSADYGFGITGNYIPIMR